MKSSGPRCSALDCFLDPNSISKVPTPTLKFQIPEVVLCFLSNTSLIPETFISQSSEVTLCVSPQSSKPHPRVWAKHTPPPWSSDPKIEFLELEGHFLLPLKFASTYPWDPDSEVPSPNPSEFPIPKLWPQNPNSEVPSPNLSEILILKLLLRSLVPESKPKQSSRSHPRILGSHSWVKSQSWNPDSEVPSLNLSKVPIPNTRSPRIKVTKLPIHSFKVRRSPPKSRSTVTLNDAHCKESLRTKSNHLSHPKRNWFS